MQTRQLTYGAAAHLGGGSPMMTPEDVAAIVRLKQLGWGSRRIARELKISRNTVKQYIRAGGYMAYKSPQWLTSIRIPHRRQL